MGAAKYMGGYKMCKLLIETLVESMGITVPVAIHLDHGHFDDALECIEVGYSSLMFDGSHLPIEENLKLAEEVIAKAHAKGISVECEVGSIGGEEDGIVGEGELVLSMMQLQWLNLVLTSLQQVSVTSTVLTQKTGKVSTLITLKN